MVWWVKCLTIGLCGGVFAGLLGVGGGIIMIPLLMALLKLPIHEAKAISLAIICLTAISGTIKHQQTGRLDTGAWQVIAVAGLAACWGGPVGVQLSEKLDRQALLRIFALLQLILGCQYLWQTRPRPQPDAPAAVAPAPRP